MRKRPRISKRRLFGLLCLGALGGVCLLWYAIHRIPWLGPSLADGTRKLLGPRPVAWLEDTAYMIEDHINRLRYRNAPPKTYWSKTETHPLAPSALPTVTSPLSTFHPPNYAPPFQNVAAEGDGVWIAMSPTDTPTPLWKSMVHPDPKRTFAVVAIVAIDLKSVSPQIIAGTEEPESIRIPITRRPGLVPREDMNRLIAVFNGGFKAVHGNYGMRIGSDIFLQPRDIACTISFVNDGNITIGTWSKLKSSDNQFLAYRQTPPCLVENNELHTGLSLEMNRNWGATVSGDTIIRRSAIGLDALRNILFYGLGDAVTARAIAKAMQVAGATDVAELDVNYSYPRFLMYEKNTADHPPKASSSLIPDAQYDAEDYVIKPSRRDFFYLTSKDSIR